MTQYLKEEEGDRCPVSFAFFDDESDRLRTDKDREGRVVSEDQCQRCNYRRTIWIKKNGKATVMCKAVKMLEESE